jgi:hypothetical protein
MDSTGSTLAKGVQSSRLLELLWDLNGTLVPLQLVRRWAPAPCGARGTNGVVPGTIVRRVLATDSIPAYCYKCVDMAHSVVVGQCTTVQCTPSTPVRVLHSHYY